MMHFANLESAPVLPIHDSFIVHHAYGETLGELEETMRRTYFNVTGGEIRTTAQIGNVHPGMPKFPDGLGEVDYLEWFRQNEWMFN